MNGALTVSVRFAWWFPLYLRSLILFFVLMRAIGMEIEPDWDKVGATVKRAIRIRYA